MSRACAIYGPDTLTLADGTVKEGFWENGCLGERVSGRTGVWEIFVDRICEEKLRSLSGVNYLKVN